jgi:glycosyltransferase involved in cell wall biosynthesis
MKPLITALIDTYNHERYIEQALVSVLEQGLTSAELEILVVDDGSTDKTPGIIEKFGPRVKHLRKKNGGQASAFNAGFAEAHGEIVAILDGDDWWAKGKLAVVTEVLERNPEVSAVSHGYFEFRENTQETFVRVPPATGMINIETSEAIAVARQAWPFLLMGALTVRRSLLEWMMPISEEAVFMADTAIQAAAIARKNLVLEAPLFYYRYHGHNLWAIDPTDETRLRRRYDMAELVYSRVCEMLMRLGVREDKVAALVYPSWIEASRRNLQTFGGSPVKTFRTEMRAFHSEFENASPGYRFFKYVLAGTAMLLLPPRPFYRLRDWYAREKLGQFRERIWKAKVRDDRS